MRRMSCLPSARLPLLAAVTVLAACGDDASNTSADSAPLDDTAADVSTPEDVPPEPPPETTRLSVLFEDPRVSVIFGRSTAITFDVPPGTVSVSVSAVGARGDYHTLDGWSDDAGTTYVNANWLAGPDGQQGMCLGCPNRVTFADGAFATLAPNNPSVEVRPGRHTLRVLAFTPRPVVSQGSAVCGDGVCHTLDQFNCQQDCGASPVSGTIAVQVLAKVADDGALPARGVLDLNLHFTGAEGLSAESARNDPTFQGHLETMRTLYAQVGVSLGDITYRDIDPSYAVIESFDGPEADLSEMFALSDGNPEAVNLFFVSELSAGQFGGFAVVLGISGGIPGPPRLQGSPRSGVAIAVKPVEGAPAGIATTMAHEVGHFLGLFHTSEQNFFGGAGLHDPIPDTPENDEGFLMFNTGAGSQLSPQQGAVMRANPFVRHPAAE
jgi:hypothetical protein